MKYTDAVREIEKNKKEREYTPEERERNIRKIAEIRDYFVAQGVFKKPKQYQLRRSALVEYEQKYGMACVPPPGTEIIEDIKSPNQ